MAWRRPDHPARSAWLIWPGIAHGHKLTLASANYAAHLRGVTTDAVPPLPDDIEYLRRREASERSAAEDAACMARTAHEDLADEYADRAQAIERASADAETYQTRLLDQIDALDRA